VNIVFPVPHDACLCPARDLLSVVVQVYYPARGSPSSFPLVGRVPLSGEVVLPAVGWAIWEIGLTPALHYFMSDKMCDSKAHLVCGSLNGIGVMRRQEREPIKIEDGYSRSILYSYVLG
jgi:hypothetical protein